MKVDAKTVFRLNPDSKIPLKYKKMISQLIQVVTELGPAQLSLFVKTLASMKALMGQSSLEGFFLPDLLVSY